jgi:archaellin
MVGGILIAFVLVVVIPAGVLISAALAAFLLGSALTRYAEGVHQGSELIDTNY